MSSDNSRKIASKFSAASRRHFWPYIRSIRFPHYKALEPGLEISFEYPITAIIGPNGTNKSSILQALASAPEGQSLAQFWFSTAVDDIDGGNHRGATHRFIYKYEFDESGTLAECRKYRGSKKYRNEDVPRALQGKRDPDYWEPTKRVESDSMAPMPSIGTGFDDRLSRNRDRWNQIRKHVVYIDFRSELSAFDKFIHHQAYSRWTPDATAKRYSVVIKSDLIAKALDGEELPRRYRHKLRETVRELDPKSLEDVSTILGKKLASVRYIQHDFFGPPGYTVKLRVANSDFSYSEAHAGSGEYAIVRLVDLVKNAEPSSLILLDEPEVSLHPGAQAELVRFLEREVLAHGHQVVMSTHSPVISGELPEIAIKVLAFDATSHQVKLLADQCSPTEAFVHLGQTLQVGNRPLLIVEDDLAAEIVRYALRARFPARSDALDIRPFPGGANSIVRNVLSTFAIADMESVGVLLDGDQVCDRGLVNPGSYRFNEPLQIDREREDLLLSESSDNFGKISDIWVEFEHSTLPHLHSNSDKATDYVVLKQCLNWARKHLRFLPGGTPEAVLAAAAGLVDLEVAEDWDAVTAKNFWRDRTVSDLRLTANEVPKSADILDTQKRALIGIRDSDNWLLVLVANAVQDAIRF